jgi:hypothetical protein
MEGVLYTFMGAVIIAISGWTIGRFAIKTKIQVKVEKHETRLCEIENTQPLVVEGMFVLLQSAKRKGEINGESDDLMRRFNDHLFDRKK